MSIVAIIPCAGEGRRLGMGPKALVEVAPGVKCIDPIVKTVSRFVDDVVVVASPNNQYAFAEHLMHSSVGLVVQRQPLGMGDAVFRAYSHWRHASRILVVWGDQPLIRFDTVQRAVETHAGISRSIVVPTVKRKYPYTHWGADQGDFRILRRRDLDSMPDEGMQDIGVFVIDTMDIMARWSEFIYTLGWYPNSELSLLPFIEYLVNAHRWRLQLTPAHTRETLGINTPEELESVMKILQHGA